MIEIVNAGYEKNKVWFLMNNGEVRYVNFGDIEHPYFYSSNQMSGNRVISSTKENVDILTMDGVQREVMYRTEVNSPYDVKILSKGIKTAEADILYLERRLGADGIVKWVKPDNYIYIDIEDIRKEKRLFGGEIIQKGVGLGYKPFYSIDDFMDYIKKNRVTAILAWNGDNYDFKIIDKYINNNDKNYWDMMLKFDAMRIYTKIVKRMPMRSLDYVARLEGIGKKIDIDFTTATDTDFEIYNKQDVWLEKEIIERNRALDSLYELCSLTGLHPFRLLQSWMIENIIMKTFPKIKLLTHFGGREEFEYPAALVVASKAGIYYNVAVLDVDSLYPNIVINREWNGRGKAVYDIIKKLEIDFVAKKSTYREAYKQTNDVSYLIRAEAYKVLANGSYGLFGLRNWRYVSKDIATFITEEGRKVLMQVRDIIEKNGFKVLYSHTDSAFVCMDRNKVNVLVNIINKNIYPFKIKLDKYYSRLIFIATKEDVKNRYAGIDEKDELDITGLEAVRHDWCEYAKDVQKEALNVILRSDADKRLANFNNFVVDKYKELNDRKTDLDKLAFFKSIDMSKDYKVKTRALKALDKLNEINGESDVAVQFVEYYMGKDGQILVEGEDLAGDSLRNMIDWNWYKNVQVTPILERIKNSLIKGQLTLEIEES